MCYQLSQPAWVNFVILVLLLLAETMSISSRGLVTAARAGVETELAVHLCEPEQQRLFVLQKLVNF